MAFGAKKSGEAKPKNWYQDRYESVVIQRNILALIAVLSLLGSAASVFAVATLTGSKTFEPFIIQIEKKTGIVTTLKRNSTEEYTGQESIKRYFLVQYVRAREGFDMTDFQYNSRLIRFMSNSDVFDEYKRYINPQLNPQSPANVPTGFKKIVKIKSISFIDPQKKKAQVRIVIEDLNAQGQAQGKSNKICIIDFDFLPNLSLSGEDRYINPLGFIVKSYRIDSDVE